MKIKDKIEEILLYIIGRVLIVLTIEKLNLLEINAYKLCIEDLKKEKKLLKISKKMKKLEKKIYDEKELYSQSSLDLFYNIYNRIDELTLKELKDLKSFCFILKCNNSITDIPNSINREDYYEHIENINKYIQKNQ